MRKRAQVVAAFAAFVYLAAGLWAFAAPLSFATNVATYPPYNQHLIHDLGAFQIGLGAAALAALLCTDALVAVLVGVAAGSVMHEMSHITDQLLGGRPTDPYTIGAFAVVVLVGLLAAARAFARRGTPPRDGAAQRGTERNAEGSASR